MNRKSLRTSLMQAAALGVVAMAAWGPGKAEAQDLCVPPTGPAVDCSGDQSGGVQFYGDETRSITVHDLTTPISPFTFLGIGAPGVALDFQDLYAPFDPITLTLTLDQTVNINVRSFVNSAVIARGTGESAQWSFSNVGPFIAPGPVVNVASAANINYDSALEPITRADAVGNPGLLAQLESNLEFGERVRLAFEMQNPDAAALAAIDQFNCLFWAPRCQFAGLFGPPPAIDREKLVPGVYDYLATNRASYLYWSAPPPPEELARITAAIEATSTGGREPIFGITDVAPGGDVTVSNTGDITTIGANAVGIYAQSRGADYTYVAPGGTVTVVNDGAIHTQGAASVGIFARSLGGAFDNASAGGLVDIRGAGSIYTQGHSAYGVYALSAGGNSTNDTNLRAGNGGTANVSYGGEITTEGVNAHGVVAVSTGGAGGYGGGASATDSANRGGIAGDGGEAFVELLEGGSVYTWGDGAHAITATSRGGVGGHGGESNVPARGPGDGGAGGLGGEVTIINNGELATFGDSAYGVFAQSIAGAGGRGGNSDAIFTGTGGSGGPAGRGGDIVVENFGEIFTIGRRSFGVFAQSLGGEGGAGGDASGWISVNGGQGGTAQSGRCLFDLVCPDGGSIVVWSGGLISTGGYGAHDIFAQSIGGGGGQGGDGDGWLRVAGGTGGDAGNGGLLNITNDGSLFSAGDNASGIFAQSIGGGGGSGGDALGIGLFAAITIGGTGGAGGNGGEVYATNNGVIDIGGERSNAIFAQSIGGGGGSGGSATSIAFGPGAAASIAIGGNGQTGGDGEYVEVFNTGEMFVRGDFSNGIFAQSVGGGGGVGGAAYAYSLAVGDKFTLAASVAIGGHGGLGGRGGDVRVVNEGEIVTFDFNSIGIIAQSVGGGGGVGGASLARSITVTGGKGLSVNASVAVGGEGGAGDVGGAVNVNNEGSITTLGDASTGIFAQSIGGSGGLGGDASTSTTAFSAGESSSLEVNVSIGGSGGSGNHGGIVTVTNNGNVLTLGNWANGITAQSVGGGGGVGGLGDQSDLFEDFELPEEPPEIGDDDDTAQRRRNARQNYAGLQEAAGGVGESSGSHGRRAKKAKKSGAASGPTSMGIGLSIGGGGGAGGNGEIVTVENYGEIITGGLMSYGVFAQSIGGGGGAGGAGEGEAVGDISIGGGIGGAGGGAGDGGNVIVRNFGGITTLQDLSYGVLAQSIGGGGGVGGLGKAEHETLTSIALAIGGAAGSAGDGGDVTVNQTGDVLSFGVGAIGVLAQSVGGGGGIGGAARQDTFGSIALGGSGGSAGDGGVIVVTVDGDIVTEGDIAHGVFAQSVGGGGGLGGGIETRAISIGIDPFGLLNVDTGLALSIGNLSVAGDAGGGGDGEAVTVETSGTITTFGRNAYGIFAQSIGGGGGSGGSVDGSPVSFSFSGSNGAAGVAGAITITHDGDIRTYGENSIGIFAQSVGGAGSQGRGGDITVTLNGGDVIGGSGEGGAGVMLSGGGYNVLRNNGGLISALSGVAIAGTDGDDIIYNSGTIRGSVGLGGGANALYNLADGLFESGVGVYVGDDAFALVNSGELSPYGEGETGETVLAGDYIQHASGVFSVNLDLDGPSDLVTVQGVAALAGRISPLIAHVSDLRSNVFATVLSADSIINNGISIDAADTLVIDYGARINGGDLQIGIEEVAFDLNGLSSEQSALAGHLQSIWGAGGTPEMDALMDYLGGLTNKDVYSETLTGLHPFSTLTEGAMPLLANQSFLGGLMSCPDASLREKACSWVRAGRREGSQEAAGVDSGYEQETARYQGGAQFALRDNLFAGVSLGYERGEFTTDASASQSESVILGGVLKRQFGDWLLAGGLDYAHINYDRVRVVSFPSPVAATSTSEDSAFAARLRLSYLADQGAYYVRPMLDLDAYTLLSGGFDETGAGALNLSVEDEQNTIGSAAFALEVGGRIAFANTTLRPFVQIGATTFSAESIDLNARFEGAPVAAEDFIVSSRLPETLTRAQIGLDWTFEGGAVRLDYEERNGHGYEDRASNVKLRFDF